MNHTHRWSVAAGTAVLLAIAPPALAGGPRSQSGGPGTLGVEVPFDSREAELYYQMPLPTNTPEALRIRDGMQRLHAAHQGALALAEFGIVSADPRVRALALTLRDDHARLDWALMTYAHNSHFDMAGTAFHQALQEGFTTVQEVQAAPEGPARDEAFLSSMVALHERTAAGIDELVPQSREARRQLLTSHLERERKLLRARVSETRAALGPGGAAG